LPDAHCRTALAVPTEKAQWRIGGLLVAMPTFWP
jgi:hypothetical protein